MQRLGESNNPAIKSSAPQARREAVPKRSSTAAVILRKPFALTTSMIDDWENIAEALRYEMLEYGALLNLFAEQQRAIFTHDGARALHLNVSIFIQKELLNYHRQRRRAAVRKAAELENGPGMNITLKANPIRALLPSFPEPVRPLIRALADEVAQLTTRSRSCARYNEKLLSRSGETVRQARLPISRHPSKRIIGCPSRR